jgi:hypothetical protein
LKDKIKLNTHKDGLPKGFIDVLLKWIITTNADATIVELLVLDNQKGFIDVLLKWITNKHKDRCTNHVCDSLMGITPGIQKFLCLLMVCNIPPPIRYRIGAY